MPGRRPIETRWGEALTEPTLCGPAPERRAARSLATVTQDFRGGSHTAALCLRAQRPVMAPATNHFPVARTRQSRCGAAVAGRWLPHTGITTVVTGLAAASPPSLVAMMVISSVAPAGRFFSVNSSASTRSICCGSVSVPMIFIITR